jgi:hypothetical protein
MNSRSYRLSARNYKSSFRNLAYSFFASREKSYQRCSELRRQLEQAEKRNQRLVNEIRELQQQRDVTAASQPRIHATTSTAAQLPADPALKGHQFGARMIALCCQLCKQIGFRASERALHQIGQWLGVELKVPTRGTMRNWCSRHGVAILQYARQPADDWIWLIDHHVPIGNMVALVILGIRQSELPVDRPLRREDMNPLAIVPSASRRKGDVQQALFDLSEEIGAPISIVSDGASELHQGTKALENRGFEVVLLDDIKHKAANILKKLLGQNPRFKEFESHLGKTTARIQQTELDHFLPPKKRTKCRFMNLGKLIDWADMVLHHHHHPQAVGLESVSPDRFEDKLGWLKEFEPDLNSWRECRQIISKVLEFTNRCGVYEGSTAALKDALSSVLVTSDLSRRVSQRLVSCCQANEQKLLDSSYRSLRLICSTEVLESSLAGYKQLQKHHQRGTFTSLLAVLPTLFVQTNWKMIRKSLEMISTKNMQSWLRRSGLTNSTQTRKTAAYKAALG